MKRFQGLVTVDWKFSDAVLNGIRQLESPINTFKFLYFTFYHIVPDDIGKLNNGSNVKNVFLVINDYACNCVWVFF